MREIPFEGPLARTTNPYAADLRQRSRAHSIPGRAELVITGTPTAERTRAFALIKCSAHLARGRGNYGTPATN